MSRQIKPGIRNYWVALGAVVAAVLLPAGAEAHTGDFAQFNYCPSTTPGVAHCLHAVTESGELVLGKVKASLVNPVTVQAGYSTANAEGFSTLYPATNGETLSKTPQPVPGGLLGILPPSSSPPLVKQLAKRFFENRWTKVDATLELAEPAGAIALSVFNALVEEGVALQLKVKVHLENPFLGSSCYIGSNGSPIVLNFTTGITSPPEPNQPIDGKPGFVEIKDDGELAELTQSSLVDNAWSAPAATGCGGPISFLVDPLVDARIGLPAAAGHNTAILNETLDTATVASVNDH